MPALELSPAVSECVECCLRCSAICMEKVGDLLEAVRTIRPPEAVRLLTECVRSCSENADLLLTTGIVDEASILACADACDRCTEYCESAVNHDESMKRCADRCRHCADTCRRLIVLSCAANVEVGSV